MTTRTVNRLTWSRAIDRAILAGQIHRTKQRVHKDPVWGWTWGCACRCHQ